MEIFGLQPPFFNLNKKEDIQRFFPLTSEYLFKDPMYLDPTQIKWFLIKENKTVVGVFSFLLKDPPIKDHRHIPTFEISSSFRGLGLGTKVLKFLKEQNLNLSLRCSEPLLSFYLPLGFEIKEHCDGSFLLKW